MRRVTPAVARCAALVLALAGAAAPQLAPQGAGRFAGWEELRDADYVFDPDERPALGFSVRSTPAARDALERAQQALDAGDAATAARLLQDAVWLHGDAVLQVAGDAGRWVGAGEWALFQLLARVPAAQRATLALPSDRSALAEAVAWRDVPRLLGLARRLEGLPEGAQAAAAAARLLHESGHATAAAAAADRARLGDVDAGLPALPPPEPAPLALPVRLAAPWRVPLVVAGLGPRNPFQHAASGNEAPIAPVVPVVAGGAAYLADSISVSGLDLLTGRRLWHREGPLEAVETQRAADRWFPFSTYVDNWRARAVSPWQLAQPAVADGRVVASLQAAQPLRELNTFEGIPINWPLPERRLVCLDARDGAELWRQERPERGPDDFVNRFSAGGAPLVADGVVYAAGFILEGALNAYLAAFDLADGTLLWRSFLCSGQQDLTMFNRPFQEHTPGPPLLHDGALYACTNLGVVASVDAFSGRVRWLAGYEYTARRASRSPDRDVRRDVLWVNRAPQLAQGNLLVMPLDGQDLLALDPATGRTRWRLDVLRADRRGLRHDALALPDGRLVLAGEDLLEVFDARSGRPEAVLALPEGGQVAGPLALAGGELLVPAAESLLVADVAARRLRELPWDAALRADEGAYRHPLRRRVVPADRGLLVTDGWALWGLVDVGALLAEALARPEADAAARLRTAALLLAAGRPDEAAQRCEAVLADAGAGAAQREEAARLRLYVALQQARASGAPQDWEDLLEAATRLGRPFEHAEEALEALDLADAAPAADAALARLAAADPHRRLSLALRGAGRALPAGLLAGVTGPADEEPAAAVARLQELLERWPDEPWLGQRLHDWAAARQADLIARHGRACYARWDALAAAGLDHADGPEELAALEARYPNALAVGAARERRLTAWLERGDARAVLEDLAAPAPGAAAPGLAARRRAAAEALGESALAARLAGAPGGPRERPLPALPGAASRAARLEVSTRGRLVFPPLSGTLGPGRERQVLGALGVSAELLLLDAAGPRVSWRRPLPGGLTSVSSGYLELFADGERLLALSLAGQAEPVDRLTALRLTDGAQAWTRELDGATRAAVLAEDLLLRLAEELDEDGGRRLRLQGFGTASGALACVLDLPPCEEAWLVEAGGTAVVFTAGALARDGATLDARLWRVDALAGRLQGGERLDVPSPRVLVTLDDPPTVLLALRPPGGGPQSLLGWDVEAARSAWTAAVPTALLSRTIVFPAGAGRLALYAGRRAEDGSTETILVPVDARLGPLPPTATGATLGVLSGQGGALVPRLVLAREGAPQRLFVADARTTERLFELELPGVTNAPRVVPAHDGFALVQEAGVSGGGARVRLVDGASGAERYSVALETPRGTGRAELALVEGALVLAWGGTLHVVGEAP